MNPCSELGRLRQLWTCSHFCNKFLLDKYLMELSKRIHRPYMNAWVQLLLKDICVNFGVHSIASNINPLKHTKAVMCFIFLHLPPVQVVVSGWWSSSEMSQETRASSSELPSHVDFVLLIACMLYVPSLPSHPCYNQEEEKGQRDTEKSAESIIGIIL